jgi:hypothetical protein
MKLPTLRQVSGFAMIVNTFLPAIVVVTLGLMIWSTVTTIKRNTCATINYVTLAMNDDNERKNYIAAGDDAKKKALEDLVKRLNERPLPDNGSCGPWQDLRTRIKGILTNELYGETLKQIEYEMKVVDEKFQKAKTEVKRVIPKIPPIKPPGIPGIDEAISAVNQLFRIIHTALAGLGDALSNLGHVLTEPFDTAGEHLYNEFQTVDYKRAVAWELLDRFWSDTVDLFDKFWWFFVILALWLVLSYALWVYRRLAVGWALLCNREAV